MSTLIIPDGYKPLLSVYDTQKAIGFIHNVFERNLGVALNLSRVSAPLFVETGSGLNDDLNGVERPVKFTVKEDGRECEVVHSLAKWKRYALKRYDFHVGKGLYTDMNAIRRDEDMDNLHSIYVDQWDWERVINESDRTPEFFQEIVRKIVKAVCDTEDELHNRYPQLDVLKKKNREVFFITSQELEDRFPDLEPKEREHEICKEHDTVCIMQIGGALRSGEPHDGRAPDYDDWDLNGDIIFRNDVLDCAFELSSMGIRVSPESLARQLKIRGCEERAQLPFHKALLAGELPFTIGGGIGQSRLCMLLMGNAHIGEVQSSVWDDETRKRCSEAGILIL